MCTWIRLCAYASVVKCCLHKILFFRLWKSINTRISLSILRKSNIFIQSDGKKKIILLWYSCNVVIDCIFNIRRQQNDFIVKLKKNWVTLSGFSAQLCKGVIFGAIVRSNTLANLNNLFQFEKFQGNRTSRIIAQVTKNWDCFKIHEWLETTVYTVPFQMNTQQSFCYFWRCKYWFKRENDFLEMNMMSDCTNCVDRIVALPVMRMNIEQCAWKLLSAFYENETLAKWYLNESYVQMQLVK